MKTIVVIPAYGKTHLTHACVRDCLREEVDVAVHDNQGDYATVATEQVRRNRTNRGWLRSTNDGWAEGFEQGYDMLVSLNNDTRLSPNFFAGLQAAFRKIPSAGLVVPRYNNPMSRLQFSHQRIKNFRPRDTAIETDYVDGTCLCVSRMAYAEFGGLDPYFLPSGWGADVDYCLTLRRAGWAVVVSELSLLQHARASTAKDLYDGGLAEYEARHLRETRLKFRERYGPDWPKKVPFHYNLW